jgi:uncharacterized membrane protein
VTAAIIATALLVAGGIASGWITAYVQRGKRADADLSAAANKALAASRLEALEAALRDNLRRAADVAARDAEIRGLRDELAALDALVEALPDTPESRELLRARLKQAGIFQPGDGE